jgi:hypothetical protein
MLGAVKSWQSPCEATAQRECPGELDEKNALAPVGAAETP